MSSRCGFVALIGWTNVGKSTLLNRLVGVKLAAVADVAQTTRRRITGACVIPGRGQILFVDTPGIHQPRHRMNRTMVQQALQAVREVDVAVLMVDAASGPGPGDRQVARDLVRAGHRRIAVLNKIDRVRPKSRLLPMLDVIHREWGFEEVIPLSALTGDGCDRLLDRLLQILPEAEPLFPEDYLTDQPERVLAAEWIREKLLQETREELPHAIAVTVDRWTQRDDGLVEIDAAILVERDSQKGIVIGSEGSRLKRVGVAAREELERLLGCRVHLQLWVRVRRAWRDDARQLRELGLG